MRLDLVLHRKGGPRLGGQPGGSVVPAHGQVHKREHIELRHDGEAQEHAVQEKAPAPELLVQLPLVQVNAKHLQHTQRGQRALEEAASGGERGFGGRGRQWPISQGTKCL